jgi:hypothetical protein
LPNKLTAIVKKRFAGYYTASGTQENKLSLSLSQQKTGKNNMSNFDSQNLEAGFHTAAQLEQNLPNYEQAFMVQERSELRRQWQSGANWFYWIAGLSLLNFLILMLGGKWGDIAGLTITHLAARDIVGDTEVIVKIAAATFYSFVIVMFAGFGFIARNKRMWAFIVGIILYMLDGVLLLAEIAIIAMVLHKGLSIPLKDLLPFLGGIILATAFHGYVLHRLFKGLRACQQLNQMAQPY